MMMKMRFWALMTLIGVMTLVSFNATSLLDNTDQPGDNEQLELGEISAEGDGNQTEQNTPVAALVEQTARWVMAQ